MKLFEDRAEAGRRLGERLKEYKIENPIVIAMPRGGVPVGFEVAKILKAPLGVVISRKLGAPQQPELGIGAIAEGNIEVLDKELIRTLKVSESELNVLIRREKLEILRRKKLYRGKKDLNFKNKTAILIDDGIATGITAKATIEAVKKLKPKKIIFAVPVCPDDSIKDFEVLADEFICLYAPAKFDSVGAWYNNFDQVTDQEVAGLLKV